MNRRILTLVLFCIAGSSQAALLGRAPVTPSGTDYQAYYDTVLNITWLANANLALTQDFAVSGICTTLECPFYPGSMTWDVGHTYIAAMNAASYLGIANWRLPDADVNGNSQVIQCSPGAQNELLCRDNELSYHYHQNGISSGTPGPFININSYVGVGYYGSGTEYAADPSRRHFVNFGFSLQGLVPKTEPTYVWAVSTGDLLAVPIPAAAWLLGGALAGLGLLKRRQATT